MTRYTIAILGLLSGFTLQAADVSPAEVRLRETLKSTMLQLRTAETERATLQAAAAEKDKKIKELTEQVSQQGKQLAADKDTFDKTTTELKGKLDERGLEVARLGGELTKANAAHKQASELAATKEAQRAKLESEGIVLKRKVADQQNKNLAMFKLGNEILARYEKFGLGDALTAREPFIGITRVKFENLVQDYGDKLSEQKIKP